MALKRFILVMTALCLLLKGALVMANNAEGMLVLDMRNSTELPKKFRTTSDAFPADSAVNQAGFSELHAAGSSQFSKSALQKILHRLQTKELTLIDLRQESHGFLNGNSISWYAAGNAENAGKTRKEIEQAQAMRLADLSRQPVATVQQILKKSPDEEILETRPVSFRVVRVFSERELASELGLNYERFYVQDFHAPKPKEVDRFVHLIRELPANNWVYFHCRGGSGRTTTFMALYDMMRNANKVSFDDILARQVAIGGKNLAELPEVGSYKYEAAVRRLAFLKQFYIYARDNNDKFSTDWSRWLKENKH